MIPPNVSVVAKNITSIVDDHRGLIWDEEGEMKKAIDRKIRRYLEGLGLGVEGLELWYDNGMVRVRVEDYFWLKDCN